LPHGGSNTLVVAAVLPTELAVVSQNLVNPFLLAPPESGSHRSVAVPNVAQHVLVNGRDEFRVTPLRPLPHDLRNEVLFPEELVKETPKIVNLGVVDRHQQNPVVSEERPTSHEPGIDHVEPIGMESA